MPSQQTNTRSTISRRRNSLRYEHIKKVHDSNNKDANKVEQKPQKEESQIKVRKLYSVIDSYDESHKCDILVVDNSIAYDGITNDKQGSLLSEQLDASASPFKPETKYLHPLSNESGGRNLDVCRPSPCSSLSDHVDTIQSPSIINSPIYTSTGSASSIEESKTQEKNSLMSELSTCHMSYNANSSLAVSDPKDAIFQNFRPWSNDYYRSF
ncbi:hypothetical protein CEXT_506221 [Caerostris extrusa]|uniref:Uncharacterized protein n=1 Tax=Caerostris extrusa TaxID=172846 RepID=A0AAV4XE67_CAEEX|nr:hypothetical protein CEXT_506221 [Caerostris extrusa]